MKIICLAPLLCTALTPAWSEQLGYNMYGQPGLIDMPTAKSDSDGVLAFNQSYFYGTLRTTIMAPILPRLNASF
ncbi:MAG: YjbH domain-containing protein [Paracoccaceae bacterium]